MPRCLCLAQDLAVTAASELFARVSETPAVPSLARRLEAGGVLPLLEISSAAQPFFAALVQYLFPYRPVVVVTEGLKTQESFQQDITTWVEIRSSKSEIRSSKSEARTEPLFYPAWEVLPHEDKLPHADVTSDRLETLIALAKYNSSPRPLVARKSDGSGSTLDPLSRRSQTEANRPSSRALLVVTSVVALLQRTFLRETLEQRTRTLARGDRIDPLDLVEWIEAQGYEPEAQVTQRGELSLRGGILDIFPTTSPWPVRLEFFGDELESLREFDPITQISRAEITSVTMPPAGELGFLRSGVQGSGLRVQGTEASGAAAQSRVQGNLGSLLDYLSPDTIFLLCDPEQLEARADEYAQQVPEGAPFFIAWHELQDEARQRGMTLLQVSETERQIFDQTSTGSSSQPESSDYAGSIGNESDPNPKPEIRNPQFSSLDAFRPLPERPPEPPVAEAQRREFFSQLHRWLRQEYAVHIFCNNEGERQRFREIWQELGLESPKSSGQSRDREGASSAAPLGATPAMITGAQRKHADWPLAHARGSDRNGLWTHLGSLARGFLYEDAKLVVVTDAEIFGRYKVQRPRRLKSHHAQTARSALDIDFTELEESDYVVHLQHGIGKYLGLQVMPVGVGTKGSPTLGTRPSSLDAQPPLECLVIEYAASGPQQPPPKLYVPITEAHLVSKYVGAGKARPQLNALGGMRWSKTKEHAEQAVRDVAGELLSIQAARESQSGHAFAPDNSWQREFESAFIYEETPDQLQAIIATKGDMERPKPMDRLICGDVGFGKTEVGIRAAFKAVMDGTQVAVLVPTTVLAQQHFNTFRERMADYPIRIELLSRFRTRGEQQRVVRDLVSGSVDIIIGTHRLLQADIGFKDLGLVVIDEEQRFGVMHKEKFKRLRQLVDVLTLSATPIPRTLYLALTGARDMSTIQTPPHDRLPVQTIVTPYDERVIRDAIQRELNRGGQVFFLHNRVMTIETMATKLRDLLPRARIVVGHGQMHSDTLEEVMTQFVNGEADVLLSTTIIESGLDIPNANTIIIDRADRFGLSDLYQLRGRVGRYKHQAYAYLLLPRQGGLVSDVRKRLAAIRQYSHLGSGFKIAMRDLEIRGAGNLLGAEQSGHITAVGFELYCQLLKQSVAALKGEKVKPRIEVQVRLDFLSLTPAEESPKAEDRGQRTENRVQRSGLRGQGSVGAGSVGDSRFTFHVSPSQHAPRTTQHASASIPFSYVSEPRQRIEIYRKLAQATDKTALGQLEKELRDRFGPVPPAIALLMQVAEVKILASEHGISIIEVKEDRLMLTRNNDFIMIGSKFPRLTKQQPAARLREIKKFLLSL
ncbi:MAG: transcription-repair coupling factor [Verrucomicrobia bacterium]|nr:MAG: transcription-repair coupling factor [Verrucomicrobiota bacterium]